MPAACLLRVSNLGHFHTCPFCEVSVAMEAIGDVAASAKVSRLEVNGEDFDSRTQGGVLVRYL